MKSTYEIQFSQLVQLLFWLLECLTEQGNKNRERWWEINSLGHKMEFLIKLIKNAYTKTQHALDRL